VHDLVIPQRHPNRLTTYSFALRKGMPPRFEVTKFLIPPTLSQRLLQRNLDEYTPPYLATAGQHTPMVLSLVRYHTRIPYGRQLLTAEIPPIFPTAQSPCPNIACIFITSSSFPSVQSLARTFGTMFARAAMPLARPKIRPCVSTSDLSGNTANSESRSSH